MDLLESILALRCKLRLLSLNIGLLKLIVGLWESIFCVCGSIVGLRESILGLYDSILSLCGSSLGLLGVDFMFSKQVEPQEVGGGYLVIDFEALGVNFCLWELFLFLLGLILCLKE